MKNLLLICCIVLLGSCSAQRNYVGVINESNGKVGIGTKTPDELLTVKGKIHTQEVLVDLNGAVAPDYVFEHYYTGTSERAVNYNMLSLNELETYLKENHHLPKIPSAEALATEGMELKKFTLLLLQKIEELTLYTIEQQKQIEVLSEKIEKLEK
ncbi:hypothetical protein ACFQO1_12070 [Jejudonia soesokkakensis]|uniref:Uncharacterized protein n=1 Tax=Jejudonia soesokkakensis TaxID=1323432 RepID=A0ABW2MY05_9FLAO